LSQIAEGLLNKAADIKGNPLPIFLALGREKGVTRQRLTDRQTQALAGNVLFARRLDRCVKQSPN